MTHNNIISGFKATGLYTLDLQEILETAFALSKLSEVPSPPISDDIDQENLQPLVLPEEVHGFRTVRRIVNSTKEKKRAKLTSFLKTFNLVFVYGRSCSFFVYILY